MRKLEKQGALSPDSTQAGHPSFSHCIPMLENKVETDALQA